jgi:PAS domain-containing protein
MVMIDDGRYVDANLAARLAFRLSLEEMRGYTVSALTPPEGLPDLEAAQARLRDTGCLAGTMEVRGPDRATAVARGLRIGLID